MNVKTLYKQLTTTSQWHVFLLAGILLSSCSKWTEQETIAVKDPAVSSSDPELYAKYLENLKQYKQADHQYVFGWFDNSNKSAGSQGYHIDQVPDSLDYVVLTAPDGLIDREIQEMDKLRTQKGTKSLMSFDYDALKSYYDKRVLENPAIVNEVPKMADFKTFLSDSLAHALSLVDTYHYDGVIFAYQGKSTAFMSEDEKTAFAQQEIDFWEPIMTWQKSHADKVFIYQGNPQYLQDKSILEASRYIILHNDNIQSSYGLTMQLLASKTAGVPTDRFIVLAETTSLVASDSKTGMFTDGSRAIISTATWTAGIQGDIQLAGMGIVNISNDYFNPAYVYQYSKQAINILNPSINK